MPVIGDLATLLVRSLRKYDIPDIIIGGDKDCNHYWGETVMGGKRKWTAGDKPSAKSMVAINYSPDEQRPNIETHYCNICGAWKGQYGLEPTFNLYLEHTKLWMQEAIRVLRDDGVIFVNLGDSYSTQSGGMAQGKYGKLGNNLEQGVGIIEQPKLKDYPTKSKCLIPERFAIMAVDELGLILRNHIVWAKPNGMPESVTDRFSKKWESVFMFTKKPDYYFDLDGVREPHKQVSIERSLLGCSDNHKYSQGDTLTAVAGINKAKDIKGGLHINGKNPGDVWNIPTQPSPEKHFAMWPEKLVERMILCSTKPGDTVLDCFAGSGTTLRVVERLNRIGYGIDLGYKDIQGRRLTNIQKELI